MNADDYYEQRITVFGYPGVGKSALTIRLVTGNFLEEYDPTIEDSYRKKVEIETKDGKTLNTILDVLDTAGDEDGSFMWGVRGLFHRGDGGYLLVYDISSRISFEKVAMYRDEIVRREDVPSDEAKDYIAIVLVGNKCDLSDDKRQVTKEEGIEYAKECGMPFFETSALKEIHNIECFHQVVKEYYHIQKIQSEEASKKKNKKKKFRCTLL